MSKTASVVLSKTSIYRRAVGLLFLGVLGTVYLLPAPANWVIRQTGSLLGVDFSERSSNRSFFLGLDLQGGTRLEYEADVAKVPSAERQEAMNGVRDVIERRINTLGVAEPLVQTTQAGENYRVSVELAGVGDIQDAIDRIGKTPILEFKEESTESPRELTPEEQARLTREQGEAKAKAEALLLQAKKPGSNFEAVVRVNVPGSGTSTSTFLRAKPETFDVYKLVRTEKVGLVNRVIETDGAFYVVNIEERKAVTKEATGRHLLISWKDAQQSSSSLTKEAAKAKIDELKKQATVQNFESLVRQFSMEPQASSTGGLLDWTEEAPVDPTADRYVDAFAKPYFALAKNTLSSVIESPFGYHIMMKIDERPVEDVRARIVPFKKLLKTDILPPSDGWKSTKLTGKQLSSARVDFNQRTGGVVVALTFNEEGRELFSRITRENIGKRVGIFIDGEVISAPVVQSEIPGGQAIITGIGGLEEARALARNLQAGALPVPIQLIAQQTIGPSLGADSLAASLKAGLIGFALVALFMVLVYRLPGLVAIVALALYGVLSLAIFKYVPVTLTLSGIAGFILSLGIAVDSNVLAFERLKEEWALGKGLRTALEDAFRRAWPSIRDGHVTVLISCGVLYWFSSSVIRGFSLTLAIGVTLSLFTAVVTTRVWLRALALTPLARFERAFLKPKNSSSSKV